MTETTATTAAGFSLLSAGEKSRLLYELFQSVAEKERVVMVLDGGTVVKLEVLLTVVVVILALLALLLILLALM